MLGRAVPILVNIVAKNRVALHFTEDIIPTDVVLSTCAKSVRLQQISKFKRPHRADDFATELHAIASIHLNGRPLRNQRTRRGPAQVLGERRRVSGEEVAVPGDVGRRRDAPRWMCDAILARAAITTEIVAPVVFDDEFFHGTG